MNLEDYKQRRLQLERELVTRLRNAVGTARDASDDQAETGDLAHVEEMKDEYFALAQSDSAILAQVRAALARIEAGTYGQCEVDGGPIDERRLESVPWTPYCLKHQAELEDRAHLRTPSL
jgi:DnaK suppressor protein